MVLFHPSDVNSCNVIYLNCVSSFDLGSVFKVAFFFFVKSLSHYELSLVNQRKLKFCDMKLTTLKVDLISNDET